MKTYRLNFSRKELIYYSADVEAESKEEAVKKFEDDPDIAEWREEGQGDSDSPEDISVEGYWNEKGELEHE